MHQTILQTEKQIEFTKTIFEKEIRKKLNLIKVSAPFMVLKESGLNDNLNGIEKPVSIKMKENKEFNIEVVHSLAKWKRLRLKQLGIKENKGLITDMRALRPDETVSEIHSIYVDQYDWEMHINKNQRSIEHLKKTVKSIYKSILKTELKIEKKFSIKAILPSKIKFIHSEELRELYPKNTPKEREHLICKKYQAVFIIGIGSLLSDDKVHDLRAPDYDDWTTETQKGFKGLNGDILLWNPVLEKSFEISSMGIRVDKDALEKQLRITKNENRKALYFHDLLLKNKLPNSIGGGIGQSRLCMFLLKKSHIGEVQSSIWTDEIYKKAEQNNLQLL